VGLRAGRMSTTSLSERPDMDEELREQIIEFLKENLTLDLDTQTNYSGGMDGGPLYEDSKTLKLLIDGEVISEIGL
jgi:hypothetical protein